MDRRAFFTRGAGKVAHAVTRHAEEKARENSTRWIRPPFAIEELDFLLACTRCGDCIDACPHDVIFPLSAKLGVKVVSTPAMDLLNKGCHLCIDWPCLNACKPKALKNQQSVAGSTAVEQNNSNDEDVADTDTDTDTDTGSSDNYQEELPKIASATINKKTCLPYSGPECGACRVCPVEGAMIWTSEKPEIIEENCTGCALCREACIVEPKAILIYSKYKKTATESQRAQS